MNQIMRKGKTAKDRRNGAFQRKAKNQLEHSNYVRQLSDANRTHKVIERPSHYNK